MQVEKIRKELLFGDHADLRRRRKIIALSALGLIDFTLISLYQTGVIKRLPDFKAPLFDSNAVNASRKAYLFGLPDATISAVLYASNIALASAGGTRQSGRHKAWDWLLGVSLVGTPPELLNICTIWAFGKKKSASTVLPGL
ncbi:MAG: hypothetical protein HC880_10760 [Bacteroidia bacterium]|nr:hypothetical protein [Bacteroidia bacterium]